METGRVSGCCVVKRPEWSCRQSQNPVASGYPMIVGVKSLLRSKPLNERYGFRRSENPI
jgi:hypothetical protein